MIAVDLVEHNPGQPRSGIGRYTRELVANFPDMVSARLTTHVDPPLTRSASFLHHLPVGVRDRRPGSIVHFVQDLGCSQMLWRPVRPAVATSHDLGMLAWPRDAVMHRRFDRLIWRLSYAGLRHMDAVITPSEFSRQTVIERLGIAPEQVFAVHSGIDATRFRPHPEARASLLARHGLPNGASDRYLLYVGTEIPRKNLRTLFEAMRRLPPTIRLLKAGAAGHPRFRADTERLIDELHLRERVILLDDVSDQELIHLYAAADCYVCCSFLEGFGHPVLEAMACGTPVICSDAASLPEVVGGAAILVPPADADRVANGVTSVLADPALRDAMIARGLDRAAQFTWQRTAEGVVAVYRRVLGAASVV